MHVKCDSALRGRSAGGSKNAMRAARRIALHAGAQAAPAFVSRLRRTPRSMRRAAPARRRAGRHARAAATCRAPPGENPRNAGAPRYRGNSTVQDRATVTAAAAHRSVRRAGTTCRCGSHRRLKRPSHTKRGKRRMQSMGAQSTWRAFAARDRIRAPHRRRVVERQSRGAVRCGAVPSARSAATGGSPDHSTPLRFGCVRRARCDTALSGRAARTRRASRPNGASLTSPSRTPRVRPRKPARI